MISYIHLPILAFCSFLLIFTYRFWVCVDRMGHMKEVSRRAPMLIQRDILAAVFAMVPFAMASIDWFEITLPRQTAPIPPLFCVLLSIGCVCTCLGILQNTLDRLAGSWSGTRESALRTVAALRIIDAVDLAYAMHFIQQTEAKTASAERIINTNQREVRK